MSVVPNTRTRVRKKKIKNARKSKTPEKRKGVDLGIFDYSIVDCNKTFTDCNKASVNCNNPSSEMSQDCYVS